MEDFLDGEEIDSSTSSSSEASSTNEPTLSRSFHTLHSLSPSPLKTTLIEESPSDLAEETTITESEEAYPLYHEGQTKEDDDRVAFEVNRRKQIAKSIRTLPIDHESDSFITKEKITESLTTDAPTFEDGGGMLQKLLQHGEKFVSQILASNRGGNTLDSRGKSHVADRLDDEELLKNAEEEMDGHRLVTRLVTQPSILLGVAKPYQLEGLNWLINLYETGLNGILADEMGLGKTFQTISLLAYLREYRHIKGPHLILAPKSTLGNWMNELKRFCPSIDAFKFIGSKAERAEMIIHHIRPKIHDVIVTSYEMCCREKNVLLKYYWRYVIIDEAHRIKNETSKLSATVRLFKTQFRLLLTGTPLQNNLKELWALLNYLFPEIFESSQEFEKIFDLTGTLSQQDLSPDARETRNMQIVTRLHKILKPFLLRRIKKEVLLEMPPKKELLLFVPLSAMQKRLYKDILSKNIAAIQGGEGAARTQLLNLAMQLRKACNHPYLFDGYEDKFADPFGEHVCENAGKLLFMDKLIARLIQRQSRILIFSQMTRMMDILEDYCRIRNFRYCRIDGSTTGEDRDVKIEQFNAVGSDLQIFLLSTRAGGLGINLATADTVILYDSDWNPQVDLQAMDRAHRIGQKNPVNVYRLIHENTIEEKVIEKATLKLQLDTAVIQHGSLTDKQKQLSKNELMTMVQYGADHVFKSGNDELTEADLDAILARGEERSQILNDKLKDYVKKSILDFSVHASSNLYEYDGINYTNEQRKADRHAWASIAVNALETREERESRRKVRLQKEQEGLLNKVNRLPRLSKLPVMQEWQFYKRQRIQDLHDQELEFYRTNGLSKPISEEEKHEKQKLLSEGFDWSRKDFLAFIKGNEVYGREDYSNIAQEMDGKTTEEVQKYSQIFWERLQELTDWEKWKKKIEAGELLILKKKELVKTISQKQQEYTHPWKELMIYGSSHKGKITFTEEEDRWILNMTSLMGYGNWDGLRNILQNDFQWRFNPFMKSRTAADLSKRVDTLIRVIRKQADVS